MDINDILSKKEEIYMKFIDFIDGDGNINNHDFFDLIKDQHIENNILRLTRLIRLISKISNYHYRSPTFFTKIEQIIQYYKKDIIKNFTNSKIFSYFKKNKRILLYLIQEKILTIDKSIFNTFTKEKYFVNARYPNYFLTELKPFLHNKVFKKIESFTRNRLNIKKGTNIDESEEFNQLKIIGENESLICQLIRNDSIDDFISYVNKENYQLSTTIKTSIFETNVYLIENNPSLIEYASFYGSIQIFKYLFLNGIKLTSSLWFYAIHGRNADIIHLLEENQIEPPKKDYQKILNQSLKCHHNDIANYIYNNYIQQNINDDNNCNDYYEPLTKSIQYVNFDLFPTDLTNSYSFFYLCKYNYVNIVRILLETKDFNVNKQIISNFVINIVLIIYFLI